MILSIDNTPVSTSHRQLFDGNNPDRNGVEIHNPSSNIDTLLIVHLVAGSTPPTGLVASSCTAELLPGSVLVAPWSVHDDIWIQSQTITQNIYSAELVLSALPEFNIVNRITTFASGANVALLGTSKTNGSSVYSTFSTPTSGQSVTTSAGLLTTNAGAPLGSNSLGVIIANTGNVDAWISTTSGSYTWVVPAGSNAYIPVAHGVSIYGITITGTTTLTIIEYGY